jgi:hypothetical protein
MKGRVAASTAHINTYAVFRLSDFALPRFVNAKRLIAGNLSSNGQRGFERSATKGSLRFPVLVTRNRTGDYNVVPTVQDIYPTRSLDNNALIQPPSRQAYARLLAQGWTDALRKLQPEGPLWTFWGLRA